MPSHEHCRDLLGALSDYIDGELQEQLCQQLEVHLAGCPNCRVVIDTLRKTIYLYQVTAPSSELPIAMRQRLFSVLNLEEFIK